MGPDQGIYAYVAELILAGGAPYRDVWENKPPGVYLVYAAALDLVREPWRACSIRGLPYSCGQLLLGAFDLIYALAITAAVFGVARLLGLRGLALAAAPALCALFVNQALVSSGGMTPEKLMVLPATLGFCCLLAYQRRRRPPWLALAGLCGGLAFLLKQPGLMVLGTVVLVRLVALKPWQRHGHWLAYCRELAVLAAGLAVPLAAAIVCLGASGALADFVDQAVLFNLAYASADSDRLAWNFAASLWRNFNQAMALLWILASAGILGLLAPQRPARGYWPVLVWAGFDVASLFLGGSKFGDRYYVQLVPSFSVLAAVGLDALIGRVARRRAPLTDPLVHWLGVLGLGILALSTSFQMQVTMRVWNDRFSHGLALSPEELVVGWVRRNDDGSGLYIWGYASQVYVQSGARPPTRYVHHVPLGQHFARDPAFRQRRAELLADLQRHPPALIGIEPSTERLDPTGSRFLRLSTFPELEQFLQAEYTEDSSSNIPGWRLFRRRDGTGH